MNCHRSPWQSLSLGLTCLRVPVEPPLPVGTQSSRLVGDTPLVLELVWEPNTGENECEELHNQGLGGYPCTSSLVTHANLQRCLAWYLVQRYRLPSPCKTRVASAPKGYFGPADACPTATSYLALPCFNLAVSVSRS